MGSPRFHRATRGSAYVAFVIGALVFLCGLHPLQAQSGPSSDADMKAIQSYRLTESGLAKFMQATRNVMQVAKQHPELGNEDEDTDAKTLDDMAAVYDRHPLVKHAITAAGMSSREYVLFSMAVFQAGMAAGISEQAGGKLPAGVSPANVAFYKKHAAEMKKFGDELQKAADAADSSGGAAADTSGARPEL